MNLLVDATLGVVEAFLFLFYFCRFSPIVDVFPGLLGVHKQPAGFSSFHGRIPVGVDDGFRGGDVRVGVLESLSP